jgi:biopolymer transport protein ExbB/TolQ
MHGNFIQQIASILFGVEISLYAILVLSGIYGLIVFLVRLRALQKAKGDPAKWIQVFSKDIDSGTLPQIDLSSEAANTLPGRIITVGMKNAGLSPEALEKVFEVHESTEKRTLERGVAYLGTLGANAPFVGLTGTVLGILIAFNEFAHTGGQGSSEVMVAIARSLIATTLGLLVAIPAVIAFNILRWKIKNAIDRTRELHGIILARAVHAASKEI